MERKSRETLPVPRPQEPVRGCMVARFIAPMLLLRKEALPSGAQWLYELKLDGYRAIAFKSAFTGTREVRYGANDAFVIKTLTDGTACTNEVFGDPIVGTVKQCSIQ